MIFNSTMNAALAKPTIAPRWFLWVRAKNRTTGAMEQSGLWNGLTDIQLTVDEDSRTYRGAGGLVGLDAISYTAGTEISSQRVTVALLDPAVVDLIRTYDTRFASVDIHLGLINPETEAIVGTAQAFKGNIDTLTINDDQSAELEIVSSIRAGSRTLNLKQSDAHQMKVNTTDYGRRYASLGNAVKTFWGTKSE